MSDSENPGVFLNGKAQIIEMLKVMSKSERERLLKNIRMKNPQLADELKERSITFEAIGQLNDYELNIIFDKVQATVMGVALKSTPQDIQRKVLSAAPRPYAEKAYEIMTTPLSMGVEQKVEKAQNRVIAVMAAVVRHRSRTLNQ